MTPSQIIALDAKNRQTERELQEQARQMALSLVVQAFPGATVTKDEHGTLIVDASKF